VFVIATLTTLIGVGMYLYLILIGGLLFPVMMGVVAVLLLFGLVHYLFWGRRMQQEVERRHWNETARRP